MYLACAIDCTFRNPITTEWAPLKSRSLILAGSIARWSTVLVVAPDIANIRDARNLLDFLNGKRGDSRATRLITRGGNVRHQSQEEEGNDSAEDYDTPGPRRRWSDDGSDPE